MLVEQHEHGRPGEFGLPRQPDEARELLDRIRAEKALAKGDREGLVSANAALHGHVVAMSGNSVLADLIASVERRVRWYYAPIARARGKDAWDEHAELIDAIARRNSRRAADLMRRHTERTREIYHRRRQEAEHAG